LGSAIGVSADLVVVGEPYEGTGKLHLFERQAQDTWQAVSVDFRTTLAEGDELGFASATHAVAAPSREGSGRVLTVARPNGYTCGVDIECANEVCVKGLCCDRSCDSVCESCRAEHKLEGPDGVCGLVQAGTDPTNTCEDSLSPCGTTGLCDDAGHCAFGEVATPCGGSVCQDELTLRIFLCDGKGVCIHKDAGCGLCDCREGACNSGCSSDDDCIESAFCDARNTCQPRAAIGSECTRDAQCEGGHCADGLCCDTACRGQCEACDADAEHPGTCVAIDGAPRGERPACATEETNPCRALTCKAEARDACSFVADDSVACPLSGCQSAVCDGAGQCVCESPIVAQTRPKPSTELARP
jgi:hypothetical protein